MRTFVAALALACALLSTSARAAETTVRVAQMARDVTDAIRQQRDRTPIDKRTKRKDKQ